MRNTHPVLPALPDHHVPRPRLLLTVRRAVERRLTLVSAPAGWGKTVLLASWASAAPYRVGWVSLDSGDDDPERLEQRLQEAVQTARPQLGGGSGRGRGPGLIARLGSLPSPFVLVLDDAHVLSRPGTFHLLDMLVRRAPPGLRLVVSTRTDPLLPLHRYRVEEALSEIRATDLAFTVGESHALLAALDVSLPPRHATALAHQTEGWVAGLRLCALSPVDQDEPDGLCADLGGGVLLEGYLRAETLDGLDAEDLRLLRATSVLDRLTGPAVEAVTGRRDGWAVIDRLERSNLLVRLPGADRAYRYRRLLAGLLRAQLQQQSPRLATALHRRAARVYADGGDLTSALVHAARAPDWTLGGRLLVDRLGFLRLLEGPDGQRAAGLLDRVPVTAVGDRPEAALARAVGAALSGDRSAAAWRLRRVENLLPALALRRRTGLAVTASMIRLELARLTGDGGAVVRHATEALARGRRLPPSGMRLETAAHALAFRGTARLWAGGEEGEPDLQEALLLAEEAGSGLAAVASAASLGFLEATRGRLSTAERLGRRAVAQARSEGLDRHLAAVPAHLALAWICEQRAQLTGARTHLRSGLAAARGCDEPATLLATAIVGARVAAAEQRPRRGLELLAARARPGRPLPWLDALVALTRARLYTLSEGPDAAVAAVRPALRSPLSAEARLVHAEVLLAGGDPAAARAALGDDLDPDDARACLLGALVAAGCGDRESAAAGLARAVTVAAPDDLRRPFLDHATALRRLHRIWSAEATVWLCRLVGYGPAAVPRTPGRAVAEPLSERERQVLARLPSLLSTAEVAADLYVSVNTAKTHLKSIYRKLGVTSRRDAVERAAQLGLLPAGAGESVRTPGASVAS